MALTIHELASRELLRRMLDASVDAVENRRYLRPASESDRLYTRPSRIVRRMVRLSRRYADQGNLVRSRYWWRWAESMAIRCGGISGVCYTRDGYSAIVLRDDFCAHSPVPMKEMW